MTRHANILATLIWLSLCAVSIAGCDRNASSPAVQTGTSRQNLVGTWKCSTEERGLQINIVWYVRPDGTDTYTFTSADRTMELAGTWEYAGDVLTERAADGRGCRASIRWLGPDKFILTIIENGDTADAGAERHYSRQ